MIGFKGFAQDKITLEEYILKYKDLAIEEMKKNKIPASITLAQGILESANGNSVLARNANNHFGIKCKPEWKGGRYYYDDDLKHECFRKYSSDIESYQDHSLFLRSREYYTSLFLLDETDYKGWAYGLKRAGYATCPTYAEQLIGIIEDNCLFIYDIPERPVKKDTITTIKTKSNLIKQLANADSSNAKSKLAKQNNNDDDFTDVALDEGYRIIYHNNGVKYIKAGSKDNFESIAKDFGLNVSDILRFNDLDGVYQLKPKEIIYVEPKKKRSDTDFYIAVEGDTMRSISQAFAIQLKELYSKNHMKQGSEPKPGQKVWLNNQSPVY